MSISKQHLLKNFKIIKQILFNEFILPVEEDKEGFLIDQGQSFPVVYDDQ